MAPKSKYLIRNLLWPQCLRIVLRDELVDHLVLDDHVHHLVGDALLVVDVGGDVEQGGRQPGVREWTSQES